MPFKTEKYLRKAIPVDAVRVTKANQKELARWCKGRIKNPPKNSPHHGRPYIKVKVTNPLSPRQTQAFVGDWLLHGPNGFKVYTDGAFKKAFEPVFKRPVPAPPPTPTTVPEHLLKEQPLKEPLSPRIDFDAIAKEPRGFA